MCIVNTTQALYNTRKQNVKSLINWREIGKGGVLVGKINQVQVFRIVYSNIYDCWILECFLPDTPTRQYHADQSSLKIIADGMLVKWLHRTGL